MLDMAVAKTLVVDQERRNEPEDRTALFVNSQVIDETGGLLQSPLSVRKS
jgi:hypothetical protein